MVLLTGAGSSTGCVSFAAAGNYVAAAVAGIMPFVLLLWVFLLGHVLGSFDDVRWTRVKEFLGIRP